MTKVRTVFQPREEIEVDDQEAVVLEHQGLLWRGSAAELAQLLGEKPTGPAPVVTTQKKEA